MGPTPSQVHSCGIFLLAFLGLPCSAWLGSLWFLSPLKLLWKVQLEKKRELGCFAFFFFFPFCLKVEQTHDLISESLTQTKCSSNGGRDHAVEHPGILTSWRRWQRAAPDLSRNQTLQVHRPAGTAGMLLSFGLRIYSPTPPSSPPGTWFIVVQIQWLSSNFISFFRSKQESYRSITSPKFVCSFLRTVWAMFVPWESLFFNYFHIATVSASSSFSEVYKNADGGFASGEIVL